MIYKGFLEAQAKQTLSKEEFDAKFPEATRQHTQQLSDKNCKTKLAVTTQDEWKKVCLAKLCNAQM